MKIIKYGSTFQVFSDDLETYDQFPAGTYKVVFNQMSGFALSQVDNFEVIEEKIYGNHEEKVAKILRSYDAFERSLGVILSGKKGMGKSLSVQILAKEAIAKGLPVFIVNKPYPGVADFIDSIDQECLVIFDEFEKVFSVDNKNGEKGENQNSLLGLFDGTSQKKRLYAITVNKLHMVSEYMVSRPGRFHYHLRFDYPNAQEIETYLKDKLNPQFYSEIPRVIAFATRIELNYDSLRAIAFELNQGYPFHTAIGDLNILNTDTQRYDIKIHFSNGSVTDIKKQHLDLFSETISLGGYNDATDYFNVSFGAAHIYNDSDTMIIHGEDVHLHFNPDEDDEPEVKNIKVTSIRITQHKDMGVNYKNLAF